VFFRIMDDKVQKPSDPENIKYCIGKQACHISLHQEVLISAGLFRRHNQGGYDGKAYTTHSRQT
jgi:hypothetical protein